jgi:hypothetical protein
MDNASPRRRTNQCDTSAIIGPNDTELPSIAIGPR